jgi:hypothetical protein
VAGRAAGFPRPFLATVTQEYLPVGRPMSPSGALARRSSGRMGAGGRTDRGVGVGSPEDIGTGCPGDPHDCLSTGPDRRVRRGGSTE